MSVYSNIKNYFFPVPSKITGSQGKPAKSLNNFIAPVQFQRLKVDVKGLNDAIAEAEQAFYPHRVKLQRIYQDTIRNGQVHAAMEIRDNLTLLKDFEVSNGNDVDERITELLQGEWFYRLRKYIHQAKYYGYSAIDLGDLVNNEFPNIQLIKRWNVNPGTYTRLPYISSYVYSLNGIEFTNPDYKDQSGQSYCDWVIWVSMPTETGATPTGYGLLYKIAYYEIMIRNNVGFNMTANERFGMPIIWAKTDKTDEGPGGVFTGERSEFESMVANIGAAGGVVTDPTDELELLETSKGGSKGNTMYDSMEERMLKMINKIIFGHADAMDSQTGKLGGEDAAKERIRDIEKADNRWDEYVMNTHVFPKLQNLGFPIKPGYKFKILNNRETEERRMSEDANNKLTAEVIERLNNSGFETDEKYITERTGIPVKKTEVKEDVDSNIKQKLKNWYNVD